MLEFYVVKHVLLFGEEKQENGAGLVSFRTEEGWAWNLAGFKKQFKISWQISKVMCYFLRNAKCQDAKARPHTTQHSTNKMCKIHKNWCCINRRAAQTQLQTLQNWCFFFLFPPQSLFSENGFYTLLTEAIWKIPQIFRSLFFILDSSAAAWRV